MRKLVTVCCLLTFMLLAVQAAWAAPSFNGYTGMLFVPSAAVLGEGEFDLAVQSIDFDLANFTGFSFTYGATDRWEIGAAYADKAAGIMDDFSINSKFRISDFGDASIISVGALLPFDENSVSLYGVLSQRLAIPGLGIDPVTGHIGVGTGDVLDGIFAGLEGVISPTTTLMLEYDSNDINAGARFALGDRFRAAVGLFGMSNLGLQLSYAQRF